MRWIGKHLRLLAGAVAAAIVVLVVMGQSNPVVQWQSVLTTINQMQQALSTMISNPLTSPLNANSQAISNVTTLGYTAYTVATLPAEVDGKSAFVSDGTPGSSPCGGGGAGAFAIGQGGHWVCLATTSSASPLNSLPAQTGPYTTNGQALTVTGLLSAKSTNNNVQYADQFAGADFGAKVNACIAALPASGGTCDARGLTGAQTLSTTINVGSQTKQVTLLLGNMTLTRSIGAQLLYFNGTRIIGAGNDDPSRSPSTVITGNDTTAGAIAQGVVAATNTWAVEIGFLRINDTTSTNVGSVGIYGPSLIASRIHDVDIGAVATGLQIGGTGTCACYNVFTNDILSGGTVGWDFEITSNDNQVFGGSAGGPLGIKVAGQSNQFYSVDLENNTTHAMEFTASGIANQIFSPYMEASGSILLDSGTYSNSFFGAGGSAAFTDNSGGQLNFLGLMGGAGGAFGIAPYHLNVSDSIYFGSDWGTGYNDSLRITDQLPAFASHGIGFRFNGIEEAAYGHFGSAPVQVGQLNTTSGASLSGLVSTSALATPAAPTISVVGATGTTSYGPYYVVCHDRTGGVTGVSAASNTVTNGTTPLTSSNYIQIAEPIEDGCWTWDILKGNTTTSLTTAASPLGPLSTGNTTWVYKDTGQATSAYTPPTRNTTADAIFNGQVNATGSLTAATVTDSGLASGLCVQTTTGGLLTTSAAACGTTASYPTGSPAQIGGYSAANVPEGETVTGDCAFTRAGANSYTIACTKSGGVAFANSAFTDTTNANNISGGTLNGARLPNPAASTLGGVESIAPVTSQWVNSISTLGVPVLSQPSFADLSGSATTGQLPAPFTNGTASGNTSKFATASGTLTSGDCVKLDASGNIVDAGGGCGTTNASSLTSGTLTTPVSSPSITSTATALGSITTTQTLTGDAEGTLGANATINVNVPTDNHTTTVTLAQPASGGPWTPTFAASTGVLSWSGGGSQPTMCQAANCVSTWQFHYTTLGTTYKASLVP